MRKITMQIALVLLVIQPLLGQLDTANLTFDTLQNGLQIIIYSDSTLQTGALNLAFQAGSKYDRADRAGVAYLCHRLLENKQAAARSTRSEGPTINNITGGTIHSAVTPDLSHYSQSFLVDELKYALAIESQRLNSANFKTEKINYWRSIITEQERIEQEMELTDEYRQFILKNLFPVPYNLPVRGFADLLESSTNEEIRDFVKGHYRAKRSTLTVVGPMPADTVLKFTRSFFRTWPVGNPPADSLDVTLTLPDSLGIDTFYHPAFSRPVSTMLFPLPSIQDTNFLKVMAVADFLFGTEEGRFERKLKKMGMKSLECKYNREFHSGGGFVALSFWPGIDLPMDSVFAKADSLLQQFPEEDLTELDWERWKNIKARKHSEKHKSPEFIARELLLAKAIDQKIWPAMIRMEGVYRMEIDEVKTILTKYFHPQKKKVYLALAKQQ